ncbi:hypothetical protein HFP72_31270 [Nocardiopsis sp. ARC36]
MTGFVSLNGPDNSGKSTQVRMLADSWEGFCALGPVLPRTQGCFKVGSVRHQR